MSLFILHTYDSLESTNLLVRERIEANECEGFVALALEQTAGYGRMGRSWASPAGGLYMSVLLRPNVCSSVLPTISFLVAIAVRRALAHILPPAQLERVQLKWPNDIVLTGEGAVKTKGSQATTLMGEDEGSAQAPCTSSHRFGKLVGISQELVHGALCIGIGANVFRPAVSQNVTGKNKPVYIAELAQATDQSKATRASHEFVESANGASHEFVESANGASHEFVESANVALKTNTRPEVARESHIFVESVDGVSETDIQSNDTSNIRTNVANSDNANSSDQQEQQQFITRLARLILQEIEPAYKTWQKLGFEPFLNEYKSHMCLLGQYIRMQNQLGEQTIEGTVAGINSAGQLLLVDSKGITMPVISGEVTLI